MVVCFVFKYLFLFGFGYSLAFCIILSVSLINASKVLEEGWDMEAFKILCFLE